MKSLTFDTDISNKRDYIHHFYYENQEINDKIIDSLWHEIHLSTSEAEIRDENIQPNIPTDVNVLSKWDCVSLIFDYFKYIYIYRHVLIYLDMVLHIFILNL